jgi:PAS domain S-box-containing protein
MNWQFTPYAAPLLVGAALMFGIAVLAWQHRSTRGAAAMFYLSMGVIIYMLGYALEIGSQTLGEASFWIRVEYFGITTTPVCFFLLAYTYSGHQPRQIPLLYGLLLVEPAITVLLVWTNTEHELIWRNMRFEDLGIFYGLRFEPGSWYWVSVAYTWLALMGGVILLIEYYLRETSLYRRQIRLILLGAMAPMVLHAAYLAGVFPDGLDVNPYAFLITGVITAWAVFGYRFLDIMPIAREIVLASMSDAVIVADARDQIVYLNRSAQHLLGLHTAIGCPLTDAFERWPNLAAKCRQPIQEQHEDITLTIQGEARSYDLHLSPLYRQSNHYEGRLTVLRDITDRVRAETDLKESNQRLATLRAVDVELSRKLEVKYVLNIALDAAMRITHADAAFIGLAEDAGIRIVHKLGQCPDSVIGQIVAPDQGITARVVRTHEAEMVPDVSLDPDYYPLVPTTRAQLTVPLLSGKNLIGVLTLECSRLDRFNQDIFETVRLLAARVAVAIDNAYIYEERANLVKELDAFAHTVAHDLKNPLNVIFGYAEMLSDDLEFQAGDTAHEYLEAINQGVHKATNIIDALLVLAGVRASGEVKIEPLAMGTIVGEVRTRLAIVLNQSQAELIFPEAWPVALGYGPWIEEIWVNYITNALKYGGTPPRVELGFDRPDDEVIRFWVRDNGPGLAPDQQAQLFRPFTRIGQANVEGHGLGLSIVQRIAERLHGEVGVESQVGQGSLFYFTLPAAPGLSG